MRQAVERDPDKPRALNPKWTRTWRRFAEMFGEELARRYDSAEALADDLERWLLRNEPIQARRARQEKAGKWVGANQWWQV